MYFFYIVRCSDSSLYCGQTNNLERRVREHNSHPTKSARYTKIRRPVHLVYFQKYSTLQLAMKREREVKKWKKEKKEKLVEYNSCTMTNIKALQQFLLDSRNAGYAAGKEKKWIKEKDVSTSIPFHKGKWKSHDNFFGGEPYGGRTVVFHNDKPVWIMVYYGWVVEGIDANPIYKILRSALKKIPSAYPFRGPKKLEEGNYTYINQWIGHLERFSGEEKIMKGKTLVYKANYIGGLVDKRSGI